MDRRNFNQRNANRGRTLVTNTNGVTIRGSAQQIAEKLESLGRDAELDKDNVGAQRFFQAADHYRRISNNATE